MATGTIYLKETTRSGAVLWDAVVCDICMAIHRAEVVLRRGERRQERPWTGEPRECGMCPDEETAALMASDREAGHRV
jgi:hypothetical protein